MNDDAEFLATSGQYADVLRRRRQVVFIGMGVSLLLALVALGLGGGGGLRVAEATVEVRPITDNPFAANTRPNELVSIKTEVEFLQSLEVAQRVVERLDLDDEPEDLLDHLGIVNPTDTLVLHITYEAGTGDRARTRAQAFAEEYIAARLQNAEDAVAESLVRIQNELSTGAEDLSRLSLEQRGATGLERSNLDVQVNLLNQRLITLQEQAADLQSVFVSPGQVISPARLVDESGAPSWITAAGIFGLGLVGAIGAAVVVDRLDERARDENEIISAIPAPVYGLSLGDLTDDEEGGGVRGARARRTLGEYRRLRLRLESQSPGPLRSVLVATPADDGAAGEVAMNLSRVVVQGKETVAVVWSEDIRLSALDELGVKVTSSLDEVLQGDRELGDVLRPVPGQPGMALVGLSVGQTGRTAAPQLRAIYAELVERFDLVLTVAPSASSADTLELSTFTDASIIAVDSQRSSRARIRQLVQSLVAIDSDVVGAFVTRPRPWW